MSPTRAGTRTVPRRVATSTPSPSATPSRAASSAFSCANGSGAASFNAGTRPVLVRVWNWCVTRPLVSRNGYVSSVASAGGR